jgi:hypothetical protein
LMICLDNLYLYGSSCEAEDKLEPFSLHFEANQLTLSVA